MALSYDDWKNRAREHLDQGRVVDAFACFGKASRIKPNAPAPHMGMAEALWRLDRPAQALATWRALLQRKPDYLPAWMALAEASALTRDLGGAREAATQVLAVQPHEPRLALIGAGASLADAAGAPSAARALGALLDDPSAMSLLRATSVARAVALGLAGLDPALAAPLRARIAVLGGALPLALAAEAAAQLDVEALKRIAGGDVAALDVESLRVMARRIAEGASPGAAAAADRLALARAVARRYAELVAIQDAPQAALAWPVRGAGVKARVLVLADADALDAPGSPWPAFMTVLAGEAARVETGVAAFGDAQRVVDALAALPALTAQPALAARVTQLPGLPDAESARALAAFDPDLVVDLTALARPVGTLLAQRPARRALAVPGAGAVALAAPLVDAVLPRGESALPRDDGALPRNDGAAPRNDGVPPNGDGVLRAALAAEIDRVLAAPALEVPADALRARLDEAVAAHRAADPGARARYDAVIALAPWHAQALFLRGTLRRDGGDAEGAAADFAQALAHAPADAPSALAQVQLHLDRGQVAEARRAVDAALAAAPARVPSALSRAEGHVALAEHDAPGAINAFARALAADPLDAETHYNQGVALQLARHLADAARAYQRAIDLAPTLVDAHFNLGVVFDEMDQPDAAVSALEYVLSAEPRRAEAHRALLNVLARHERGAQWMAAFERFERNCPDALGLVANALEFYQYCGNYAKVQQYVERLSRGDFKPASETDLVDSLEQLLYLMLFHDIAPGTQYALYATYDTAARHVYGAASPRPATRKPGRTRIGYLSADLRDHVMGRMMLDVIRHHDRARHEVLLFSTSAEEDAVTASFREHADGYASLAGMSDADAVAAIDAADLDLLVDLSTHTRGARPAILARKPARVAITHVASAGALGLSAVDFKLTDAVADLEDADRFYVERLLRMEGCAYPLRRIAPAEAPQYSRASLGIDAGAVVIGAFVTPLKLSRRTTALWREVLERIPAARLAFSPNAAWLADAYPDILRAAGIDAARILWIPQGRDEATNLARYRLVDLVLDPMPFGNVNGTIEPLSMGVPVVTLAGQTHGERTGASILTHLGETRTIAQTGREYVDIAVRLATDAGFMASLRASLRERVATSDAFDPAAYTRKLEAAYAAALAGAATSQENRHADSR